MMRSTAIHAGGPQRPGLFRGRARTGPVPLPGRRDYSQRRSPLEETIELEWSRHIASPPLTPATPPRANNTARGAFRLDTVTVGPTHPDARRGYLQACASCATVRHPDESPTGDGGVRQDRRLVAVDTAVCPTSSRWRGADVLDTSRGAVGLLPEIADPSTTTVFGRPHDPRTRCLCGRIAVFADDSATSAGTRSVCGVLRSHHGSVAERHRQRVCTANIGCFRIPDS